MPVRPDVVVVGGGIAGLATAARLAKKRHRVLLVEAGDRLGGGWATYERTGVSIDDLPPVLHFPAPWRDLFHSTGRPLERELDRIGAALVPAPPARYVFADGAELTLPADRGGQWRALSSAYGEPVATHWRDLVDGLGRRWQMLRPLGLEAELVDRSALTRPVRAELGRDTVDQLARTLDHPHLEALVRLTATRVGSDPRSTPGWAATSLFVERTFGRWTLGRSSQLVDLLAARLALRGVEVALGDRAERIEHSAGRVTGVRMGGALVPARAVVAAVDPWQLYETLLPHPPRSEARGLRRSTPALMPAVTVGPSTSSAHGEAGSGHGEAGSGGRESSCVEVQEVVDLSGAAPVLRWNHAGTLTTYDFGAAVPDPSAGIAWQGARGWLRRPPVRSAVAGLFWAGPHGRGGGHARTLGWSTVLAAGLAAAAADDWLGRPVRER